MSHVVRLLTPENKINAATQLISSVFRQFLRFWTFQSQLSRDYLSVLVWTRLIATATDWEFVVWITTINQQPTANGNISLNKIGSRLTMVIIEPSLLVWIRLRSDSTQLDKTDIAQNYKHMQILVVLSLVEMGRIVDVFRVSHQTLWLNKTVQLSDVGSFGENAP